MTRVNAFILGMMTVAIAEPMLSDWSIREYQRLHPWKQELICELRGDGWAREILSSGKSYPPVMLGWGKNPDDRGVIHFKTVSIFLYGEKQLERAAAIGRILDCHPETWKVDMPEYHN